MESIEPKQLYDERHRVSRSRALFQGDVFKDIVLPGFDDLPRLVQIVTHPCSMRGSDGLHPRITVAPVERHERIKGSGWNGNLRVMPLAALVDDEHYAAKFIDITAAPSELLTPESRVATLSDRGIYVLQQRLVKHYTRFDVDLPALARQAAPVLWELHAQRDWVETVLDDEDHWTNECVRAEEKAFQAWLDAGEPSRRDLSKLEHNHTDLRRSAHEAALARHEATEITA